jgi:hypothetical protein
MPSPSLKLLSRKTDQFREVKKKVNEGDKQMTEDLKYIASQMTEAAKIRKSEDDYNKLKAVAEKMTEALRIRKSLEGNSANFTAFEAECLKEFETFK